MDTILKYFPDLSEQQIAQFSQLGELYGYWNERINVVSRKDIENLYEKHVLHSLAIAKVHRFGPESEILDVGTGGGFPGIPLAILFPDCKFHLVDSIGKKIKVVNEVAKAIGLENVKAQQIRAEEIKGSYDFIISRAVSRLSVFYPWIRRKIKPGRQFRLKNGLLYLKGGDLKAEIKESGLQRVRTFHISDFFQGEFFETKQVVYVPGQ
ncbi:MAG: 16S rRNA (guanine(527)-N(7))-methyltransferase RsmG [Roseivirga sp.]|nr:16S rRNA (guanine(527)-N(7))-methyltransferase RsmG [Roseivirga sp.]